MKRKPRTLAVPSQEKTFVDVLVASDEQRERFHMTSIDIALRRAINECRLFVMPEGWVFAYCRGTGPISMAKIAVGRYEGEVDAVKPLPKRSLAITYRVSLVSEDEGEKEHSVHVSLPYRFTSFRESQDPTYSFPKLKLDYIYDPDDFKVWLAEQQMIVYAKAEAEIHEEIARLKARAKHINENSRKTKPHAPSQSAFG